MNGSLALANGVLWVARSVRTTRLRAYDLDGRPLGPALTLEGPEGARSGIRAIAVDEDRRIWAADAAAGCVRAYSVSGREVARVDSAGDPDADRPGALGDPAGIAVQGVESDARILLSRRGDRRHGLLVLAPFGPGPPRSLHRHGAREDAWRNLAGVAWAGDRAIACEAGSGTIHVFRGGEPLFAVPVDGEPRLVAPLQDGRLVVACGGGSGGAILLLDASGARLATLAEGGIEDGRVHLPTGLAVEEGPPHPRTRVAVLDRDGDRIQVFTLDGRCYGSFLETEDRRRGNASRGGIGATEGAPEPD